MSIPTSTQTAAGEPRSGAEAAAYQRLREHLAYLRLPDAAAALPTVLDEARTQAWSATATLERLLTAEVDATEARRLASRQHFACLPAAYTLADFDYTAQPGVDQALIRDLATLRFHGRGRQRVVHRPTRGRQDDASHRARPRGPRGRAPGLGHHHRRPRRPLHQSRPRGPLQPHVAVLRRTEAAGHR